MSVSFNSRAMLALLHDVAVSAVAWGAAFLLRFNFFVPATYAGTILHTLIWVVPLQTLIFSRLGLYRGLWRFASTPDLKRIILAAVLSALSVSALLLMMRLPQVVPRSVLVLDPVLLVLMMGGSRFAYRAWKEHQLYGIAQHEGLPVLVLGAGEAAVSLLKELAHSKQWRVVGLLDDSRDLHGRQIFGTPVLGDLDTLSALAKRMGVAHAIVAMPSAANQARRRAVETASNAGLTVLTVPSFEDLMSGKVSVSQIRPVEVEDLLGREPVALDNAGLQRLLEGRVVMVTGGGGSIGSELCRQMARFEPTLLVLFDISEFALYQLEQQFLNEYPRVRIACVVGDVKNRARLEGVVRRFSPSILFHAAAYKHVPMMECENAVEALANNVLGTHTAAEVCRSQGVEKFILVSTDKAVNPTNVMGASKRLAEMVCQGLQDAVGMRFIMVRFGNVLGSSGSVIPRFREQIAAGGPVTVTHPEITRYFMSIPEAAQLVLQSALMGHGGEIFVLDMGEPVRITDLAREMIRLSGLGDDDIKIIFTGLRPGEKLYEEVLADDERTLSTPHPKLRIAQARQVDSAWVAQMVEWVSEHPDADEATVKQQLSIWIGEYHQPEHDLALKVSVPGSLSIH